MGTPELWCPTPRTRDQCPTHGEGPVLRWIDTNGGDAHATVTSIAAPHDNRWMQQGLPGVHKEDSLSIHIACRSPEYHQC